MKKSLFLCILLFSFFSARSQDVVSLHINTSGEVISQTKAVDDKKTPQSLEDLSKKENRFYTGKIGNISVLNWDNEKTFWIYDPEQKNFIQKQFKD